MPLFLNNDASKPIMSVGILLYRFVRRNMELLLVDKKGFFEDMCTPVEQTDDVDSIKERAIGKVAKMEFPKNAPSVYISMCKHMIYLVDIKGNEENIDASIRTKWVHVDTFLLPEVIKYKLVFRLKSKTLFGKVRGIIESKMMDVNMFLAKTKN